MYSNKRNILQLTALMLKAGITDVVVCPGSRNAPIVHTFAAAGIHCYEITDERSAGFFALGLIECKHRPVAVCCTSGSAVLNLAPAVAEAYYQPLPLFVVTADRPRRWIGQMDGQTLPQNGVFRQIIRCSVELPEFFCNESSFEKREEEWHCNRLINEAIIAMKKFGGPVHINVPLSEPLFDFSVSQLPDERMICYEPDLYSDELPLSDEMETEWHKASKPMIVVGQMSPCEASSINEYLDCLVGQGCLIIAESLSNLNLTAFHPYNFDEVLYAAFSDELAPDLVITVGGHIVSKRLKQFIRNVKGLRHWHISPHAETADLFMNLTRLVETSPKVLLRSLTKSGKKGDMEYIECWRNRSIRISKQADAFSDDRFSDLYVLKEVLSRMESGWALQVANSSMVRNLQLFIRVFRPVFCNRGINGIEGSLSTAAGYMAGNGCVVLLVGDLSFFYDQNGLWNSYVRGTNDRETEMPALRILLLNNGGGQIFHHLKGLDASPYANLIAASHRTTAEGIALENDCGYIRVSDKGELNLALKSFFNRDKGCKRTIILEATTESAIDKAVYYGYYHHLKNGQI